MGGSHSVEEARSAILTTSQIFADARLKMTKWVTNSEELREILNKEGLTVSLEGLLSNGLSEGSPKVLGVNWDTQSD